MNKGAPLAEVLPGGAPAECSVSVMSVPPMTVNASETSVCAHCCHHVCCVNVQERAVLLPCCDAQILANRDNTLASETSSNLSKGCLGQGEQGGLISESTPLCTVLHRLRGGVCASAADERRSYWFYNSYLCSPCARHQAELTELREENRHS